MGGSITEQLIIIVVIVGAWVPVSVVAATLAARLNADESITMIGALRLSEAAAVGGKELGP